MTIRTLPDAPPARQPNTARRPARRRWAAGVLAAIPLALIIANIVVRSGSADYAGRANAVCEASRADLAEASRSVGSDAEDLEAAQNARRRLAVVYGKTLADLQDLDVAGPDRASVAVWLTLLDATVDRYRELAERDDVAVDDRDVLELSRLSRDSADAAYQIGVAGCGRTLP